MFDRRVGPPAMKILTKIWADIPATVKPYLAIILIVVAIVLGHLDFPNLTIERTEIDEDRSVHDNNFYAPAAVFTGDVNNYTEAPPVIRVALEEKDRNTQGKYVTKFTFSIPFPTQHKTNIVPISEHIKCGSIKYEGSNSTVIFGKESGLYFYSYECASDVSLKGMSEVDIVNYFSME